MMVAVAAQGATWVTVSASGKDRSSEEDHARAWFATLYETTFEPVYRYALVLCRDAHRADDIASETYLRAWRARHTFEKSRRPLPWLLTIAHNVAVSQFRTQREALNMDALFDRAGKEPDPESALIAEASNERVRRALKQLTPEQQQVIVLRFVMGLSHDEIGSRLGRAANATRAIQFRALSRLRSLLGNDHAHVA